MARKKLPNRRRCAVNKGRVYGNSFFAIVDFDESGLPLGIDIKTSKVGSDYREIMAAFAVTASLALQYGVTWEVLLSNWRKRCPVIAELINGAREYRFPTADEETRRGVEPGVDPAAAGTVRQ